ncbi:MAG: penicillin-binding protein 2 [Candidatus Levyibacteriota bacterium]
MTWRYRFVFICLIVGFSLVVARLFYWQVVKAAELTAIGESQYGKVMKLQPARGQIYTSDGFPIVANRISYTVFVNPKVVENDDLTATAVAPILKADTASISALLAMDRFWVALGTNVDEKTKEQLEKLELPGVGFEQSYARFYPEASTAAHLLGFVGKNDAGDNVGYFGLEGFYERLLRGKEGLARVIQDALGRPIVAKLNEQQKIIDGDSLILSVNRAIQYAAEQKLKKAIDTYGASGGMVAVMDPKTGQIIAMAATPSFDPQNFGEYTEKDYRNPLITDAYEPGSTFKPLIMASALDEGLVTPETKCDICAGPVSIGGYSLKTWNNKYNPNITMIDVIRYSDNTGMVFVGQKLGLDKMLARLKKFGIGETTGIDLQGEIATPIKEKENWYSVDLATASFGQGISITPIQLLSAVGSIANGGIRMEPHVVAEVHTAEGDKVKIKPKEVERTISEKTARVMTEIMVNAVNNGEAQWARLKGYRIAGKTGTASIPVAGHYDPNQTIASFIGFAPADNPKFVMLVIIDRPTTSIYGADTAAPVFFSIAKDILTYYNIPSTE